MCGILGGINILPERLNSVLHRLAHRGPDETGFYSVGNISLHHTRLAIQDIERGKQPFYYENLVIIFNGEIYNHIELRARYGLKCLTNSDAETVLHLFKKIGESFLQELDGMFAMAIYDETSKVLFLARDRAGKKPLYYFLKDGEFVFGSELNALTPLNNFTVYEAGIAQYLRFGFIGDSTPYNEIFELEQGAWLKVKTSTLEIIKDKWWSIIDQYSRKNQMALKEAISHTEELLEKSIKRRIQSSDVEVGTFLSGGIDSGLITAYASGYSKRLKTFTVSFEGQFDESPYSSFVAKKYSTDHSVIRLDFSDIESKIEQILSSYGEPFGDSSAIPSYFVSSEARKYVKVILTGDGADELFGGYRRYVPFRYHNYFNSTSAQIRVCKTISSFLPAPANKEGWFNYLYRLVNLAGREGSGLYFSATTDIFEGFEVFFEPPRSISPDPITNFLNDLEKYEISGLKKLMALDFQFNLFGILLPKMDIASMNNSLECRSPFLSKELLEFVPGLNDNHKIHGFTTKYMLRQLARKKLPEHLHNLPKRGFEVPLLKWVNFDLHNLINDYLGTGSFAENFVDKQFIRRLLDNRIRVPAEKRAKMIWYLLALEIWFRKNYTENKTV
jgi:asparagine synthase (glutamine-hydrolysing)